MLEFGGDEILVGHHKYFGHLAGHIDTLIGAEVADQLNAVNKINSHLHGLRMGTWIPLSGRRGKQFLELADRDPQAALGMLLARPDQTVMVKDSQNHDRDIAGLIRGMIGAGQAEWEKKEAPAAAEKALEELVNEWQANFAMVDGELSESYQVSADKREQLAGLDRQIINTIRADKKQARNDLEALTKTYEEYMKLKAPATYWRSKRRIHFGAAVIAFIVFTILILVAGSFIVDNHTQIIAALPKAQDGTIGFGALVLVTIPALLFFWLLRLVSRVYVTNLHDLSDARHRETLITTFLAFVQSKEAPVSPDERLLILQALFRPPTVAPVDDAQPPSIYESLLKRVPPR